MPRKRTARKRPSRRRSLADGLANPAAYGPGVTKVRVAETHTAWVFLTGETAYKVKKPVKLPFLDFSTLEKRRRFCDEEIRLNRRLAPELYLGVVPIGGDAAAPRVGAEPAIEYAVKMREFPEDARLDRVIEAGALREDQLTAFAVELARFHAELPPVEPAAPGATAIAAARANFVDLEKHLRARELRDLEAVRAWTDERAAATQSVLDGRAARGRFRECHGDLHLENLLVLDDRIVAFDALEFDEALRNIDVISEAAFLAMDLQAHEREDLAYVFLTRYLEAGGDYEGVEVLRFDLVYRALVRAKVRAIKAAQKAAEAGRSALEPYLDTARSLIAPRRPLLVITHGLSGSGKTYVTDRLVGGLRALRARSDLERKRLHGLAADARTGSAVGAGAYDADSTAKTYARLAAIARTSLAAGFSAIVDATFLRRAERAELAEVARRAGARFAILDCSAPDAELRRRVTARAAAGRDASEANLAVLDRQLAEREPLAPEEQAAAASASTGTEPDIPALLAELASR